MLVADVTVMVSLLFAPLLCCKNNGPRPPLQSCRQHHVLSSRPRRLRVRPAACPLKNSTPEGRAGRSRDGPQRSGTRGHQSQHPSRVDSPHHPHTRSIPFQFGKTAAPLSYVSSEEQALLIEVPARLSGFHRSAINFVSRCLRGTPFCPKGK